jgi:CheY-like chemotaxis protein
MSPTIRPRSDNRAEGSAVILVAEDEVLVRGLIQVMLERSGYIVLVAEDGQHALEVSRNYEGTIDLLITDMRMPRLDGDGLIETIGHERQYIKLLWMSGIPSRRHLLETRLVSVFVGVSLSSRLTRALVRGMYFIKSMRGRISSHFLRFLMIPGILGCFAAIGQAQTDLRQPAQSWLDSPYIFGDWGGERTKLANMGITFSFISVNDFLADTKGDEANWSRVRGTMDIDFGQLELVPGLKFHITAL